MEKQIEPIRENKIGSSERKEEPHRSKSINICISVQTGEKTEAARGYYENNRYCGLQEKSKATICVQLLFLFFFFAVVVNGYLN